MTTIPLATLTAIYSLADVKAGNGDQKLKHEEWKAFFESDTLLKKAKGQTDAESISTLQYYKGPENASMRTRIIKNFKNSGGFTGLRQALTQLENNPNERESLFAYGLQVQKERNNKLGSLPLQPDFDVINIADGIQKSGRAMGDEVVGVRYDYDNGTWIPSVGSGDKKRDTLTNPSQPKPQVHTTLVNNQT